MTFYRENCKRHWKTDPDEWFSSVSPTGSWSRMVLGRPDSGESRSFLILPNDVFSNVHEEFWWARNRLRKIDKFCGFCIGRNGFAKISDRENGADNLNRVSIGIWRIPDVWHGHGSTFFETCPKDSDKIDMEWLDSPVEKKTREIDGQFCKIFQKNHEIKLSWIFSILSLKIRETESTIWSREKKWEWNKQNSRNLRNKEILTIFVELNGILAAKACFNLRSGRSKRSAVVQAS